MRPADLETRMVASVPFMYCTERMFEVDCDMAWFMGCARRSWNSVLRDARSQEQSNANLY